MDVLDRAAIALVLAWAANPHLEAQLVTHRSDSKQAEPPLLSPGSSGDVQTVG